MYKKFDSVEENSSSYFTQTCKLCRTKTGTIQCSLCFLFRQLTLVTRHCILKQTHTFINSVSKEGTRIKLSLIMFTQVTLGSEWNFLIHFCDVGIMQRGLFTFARRCKIEREREGERVKLLLH